LPASRQTALLDRIIDNTAATSFAVCADLLARAVGHLPDLHGAAMRLIQLMPGDPARFVPQSPWQREPAVESGFVVDLLVALVAIDQALAERAAAYMLAWPKAYDLDRVVVPAMRTLAQSIAGGAAIALLRSAGLDHLRARIAEPLVPPTDWRRSKRVSCDCNYCNDLSQFLADPVQKIWLLRAAETHRSHVEGTIRNSHVDIDTKTDRRGRPYSLVCTKNRASYERRARQRTQDLDDLVRLGG
jgi:hypothetical protein